LATSQLLIQEESRVGVRKGNEQEKDSGERHVYFNKLGGCERGNLCSGGGGK